MEVHMDNPTVVETPRCTELGAEPVVRPLAEDKAEILPAVADIASEADPLSPSPRFERVIPPADGELGLEQPSAARRGRVEKLSNDLYLHFCAECGAWGAFGYGVNFRVGRLGRWYCAAQRPQGATP
jgi:hypothetical protein